MILNEVSTASWRNYYAAEWQKTSKLKRAWLKRMKGIETERDYLYSKVDHIYDWKFKFTYYPDLSGEAV